MMSGATSGCSLVDHRPNCHSNISSPRLRQTAVSNDQTARCCGQAAVADRIHLITTANKLLGHPAIIRKVNPHVKAGINPADHHPGHCASQCSNEGDATSRIGPCGTGKVPVKATRGDEVGKGRRGHSCNPRSTQS